MLIESRADMELLQALKVIARELQKKESQQQKLMCFSDNGSRSAIVEFYDWLSENYDKIVIENMMLTTYIDRKNNEDINQEQYHIFVTYHMR